MTDTPEAIQTRVNEMHETLAKVGQSLGLPVRAQTRATLATWTADQLRSCVQTPLDSTGLAEPQLRSRVDSGHACGHERDALSEVESCRWLMGETR